MADTLTQAGEQTGAAPRRHHRLYDHYSGRWIKLAHVREGAGGFEDGTYLVAHPREWLDHSIRQGDAWIPNPDPKLPSPKLKMRRALARYENLAEKIVEQYKAALFRENVTRQIGPDTKRPEPTKLEQWWQNVDGAGTHIDDFLSEAWDLAATFGHVYLMMDKPAGPAPAVLADVQAPFLRVYTPLDAPDWLQDDLGRLQAIQFLEKAPRLSFGDPDGVSSPLFNLREVTSTSWSLMTSDGAVVERGDHAMGKLPVVVLYARRRLLAPQIGASLLGDPQLYVDLYNLTSELRELLRNQTFGLLNIPLGSGAEAMSVEDAKALLAQGVGTQNVLFSALAAQYVSPDSANVTVYQAEIDRLVRAIYRTASLAWEADSRDAEATGSLKLKREDMTQVLARMADELERADYAIANLWYRAMYGPAGETQQQHDGVVIRYPESFDVTPFEVMLEQAQSAVTLEMPPAFMKVLRKRLLDRWLPDLTEAERTTIEAAIDAMPETTPQDQATAALVGKVGTRLAPGLQPEALLK